jgi:hypothetical protein
MSEAVAINLPDVKREMEAIFAIYETALVTNDVATLDRLFWQSEHTIRYGAGENLYGISEIEAFRRARDATGLDRTLHRAEVTTFGRDMATSMTLFTRAGAPGRIGRQSQTWLRFSDGWKVVAAHVSIIDS